MKEIVIMIGPAGPDQNLINMLKQLFPDCAIRFIKAGSKSATYKGDVEPIDSNNQHTNGG